MRAEREQKLRGFARLGFVDFRLKDNGASKCRLGPILHSEIGAPERWIV